MTETVTYQRKDVLGTAVDGDLVLFDEQAGKYYATSEVGAEIWAHLSEAVSLTEICARLSETYDVDPAECEQETRSFLNDLKELGLIVAQPPSAG